MRIVSLALICTLSVFVGCGSDDPATTPAEDSAVAETSTTPDTLSSDSEAVDSGAADTDEGDSTASDSTVADSTSSDTTSTDSTATDSIAIDTALETSADTAVVMDTTVATDSAMDTGMDAPAAMCTAETGGACNSLTMPASAALITPEISATVPMVTGGGPMPDGIYKLTREVKSGGSANPSKHIFLKAGTCYQNLTQNAAGMDSTRTNGTIVLAGDNANNSVTCPIAISLNGKYKTEVLPSGKTKVYTFGSSGSTSTYREWEQL